MNALAFDNPWQIVVLVVVLVLLRLAVSYLRIFKSRRGSTVEIVDSALVAVLLVFCILRPFVVQAFYIPSASMLDTLHINDRILVNKFVYFFKEPRVGDIVVFDAPAWADPTSSQKKDFIKRVVGGPGDRIAVRNQHLYRNGVPMDEPYVKGIINYEWPDAAEGVVLRPGGKRMPLIKHGEITVPPGYLLVMGDNRDNSNDSHHWEATDADGIWCAAPFLPRENVLGKAACMFWPPNRVSIVHGAPAASAAPATGAQR